MNRPITLLYASPWGEAMRCAHLMAGRLAREGHHVLALDIDKYLASHLLADQTVLVCLEGGDETPDSVLELLDYVQSLEPGDLQGLRFSVFSLGDALKVNSRGAELDALLKDLGATRIVARMECKSRVSEGFAIWSEAVSEMLAFERAMRMASVALEL